MINIMTYAWKSQNSQTSNVFPDIPPLNLLQDEDLLERLEKMMPQLDDAGCSSLGATAEDAEN